MLFPTGLPIPMLHRDFERPEGTTSICIMIHVTKDGKKLSDFDLASLHQDKSTTEWSDRLGWREAYIAKQTAQRFRVAALPQYQRFGLHCLDSISIMSFS